MNIEQISTFVSPGTKGQYGEGNRRRSFQISYGSPRRPLIVSYVPGRDGAIKLWLSELAQAHRKSKSEFLVALVDSVELLRGDDFRQKTENLATLLGLDSRSRAIVALIRCAWFTDDPKEEDDEEDGD